MSDKQAAAQQAVDVLHEISTILVGPLNRPFLSRAATYQSIELPAGPPDTVHLHLHDREWGQPRSACGKNLCSLTVELLASDVWRLDGGEGAT